MMMNLFTIFDPMSMFNFSLNWVAMMLFFVFMPLNIWFYSNRYLHIVKEVSYVLNKEMSLNMGSVNLFSVFMCIILFFMILMNNFMGLFSYVYTSSSHLCFTLSFGLSFWLGITIMNLKNHMYSVFFHLCPQGTPVFLMHFMVLVEMISQLIRPITLSVRLAANMIAGHLILTLVGSISLVFPFFSILLVEMMLFILEVAVSVIQAYVFSMLVCLYFSELH